MLSEYEIDEYVARDGEYCPYCKGTDTTDTGDLLCSDGYFERPMYCGECGKRWIEIYQLSNIQERR